jgi:hypothetical protein
MQQHGSRKIGPSGARARILRAALALALTALVAGHTSMARAGDDDNTANESAWNRLMLRLGLKSPPGADVDVNNYTERAPLVVPPTRDLPPPEAAVAAPTPDWPKDPPKPHKTNKNKAAIIPDTAVPTPNPVVVKKPWYDPTGWFDKEEYANFAGEPVRQNLTDPPAGYRIPSPTQPYGIGPDKKAAKTAPSATDLNLGAATPPAGQTGK